MNALLCPTLLFIEDCDWNNKDKKDIFLKRLLKIFDYTLKNNIKIYWNDELELMLWEQPNLHPWLSQDTSEITTLLFQNTNNIRSSVGYNVCKSEPNIISTISSKNIISPTLSLIHYMLEKEFNFDFIVDEPNNHKFTFSCECHNTILIPKIKYLFDDSINISEEINKRWDRIKTDNNLLTELFELVRQKYFPEKVFVYKPEYDASFVNSFYKTSDKKEKIVYTIVQRLTLKPNEVAKFIGFHDESIKSTSLRSFRINDVCRVYYEYKKDNIFLFRNYTGSSEHDKGTRHT